MEYIALLRGINVGKSNRISMVDLKKMFEELGCAAVKTYLASGNVKFSFNEKKTKIQKDLENALKKELKGPVPVLLKTIDQIKEIADAIPEHWKNDREQKTDVAYLFDSGDHEKVISELPVRKEFLDIRSVEGAVFWNVKRADFNKSHLSKISSHPLYQSMTVRNLNTARKLTQF